MGGRYRLERELGAGGMGAVWIAVQEGLGRRVALKTLLPALAQDAQAVTRFKREAELAASLGHPHIVQVTDFGSDEGGAFLVMELLQGRSLGEAIENEAPMDPARLATIAQQVLSALAATHERGVVHRDLKPDNVFLTRVAGGGELVKLLDFGIARMALGDVASRLTQTGQILGTPLYMAPEQARAQDVDGRTDLYALGAILYEAASGQRPFEASTYPALIAAIVMDEPTPLRELRPSLPADFVAIVETAMAKEPDQRFRNPDAMSRALGSLAAPASARRGGDVAFAATMAAPAVDSKTMHLTGSELEAVPEPKAPPRLNATVALTTDDFEPAEPPPAPPRRPASKPSAEEAPTTAFSREPSRLDHRSMPTAPMDVTHAPTRAPSDPPELPTSNGGGWLIVAVVALLVALGVGYAYYRKHSSAQPSVTSLGPPEEHAVDPLEPAPAPTAEPSPEPPVAEPPAEPLENRERPAYEFDDETGRVMVEMMLASQNEAFLACGIAPAGPLLFRFTVAEDGQVSSATIGTDRNDPVNQCRARALQRFRFPERATGRYAILHTIR